MNWRGIFSSLAAKFFIPKPFCFLFHSSRLRFFHQKEEKKVSLCIFLGSESRLSGMKEKITLCNVSNEFCNPRAAYELPRIAIKLYRCEL